jgi:hypothetical protein
MYLPGSMRGDAEVLAPQAPVVTSLSGSAVVVDLGVTAGQQYFTFQAGASDIFVRFRSSAGSAGTTSSNGWRISASQKENFAIEPSTRYVDVFGASGDMRHYASGRNFDVPS